MSADEHARHVSSTPPTIPGWVAIIVILGALLAAAGGIIAAVQPTMLVSAGAPMTAAAYVYAGYLISRGLALAVMLLAALALRARQTLLALMALTTLIQVIDIVVDATTGRLILLPILVIYAVAFLLGASRLAGQPLWRAAWR